MADAPCAGCGKPMGFGDYEVANDKEYHTECFVCYFCRKPFPNGEFFMHNDHPCHNKCIDVNAVKPTEKKVDLCAECGKEIPENYEFLAIKDPKDDKVKRMYHPQCVMCAECGKQIGDAKYGLSHNKAVHEACLHAKQTFKGEATNEFDEDLKCDRCNEQIRGQRKVVPNFGTFHLTCFRCVACGLGITDKFFKDPASGKALCHRCPP
jgi:DNA-directed RNA polymerase subunit N (RpoN/RPB10)